MYKLNISGFFLALCHTITVFYFPFLQDEKNDSLIFQMWQRSYKENKINSVSNDKGGRTRQTKDGEDKGDEIGSRTDSGNSSMPSSESIQVEIHPEESSTYKSNKKSCDDKEDIRNKTPTSSTKPRYYFGESPDLENIVNHNNAAI